MTSSLLHSLVRRRLGLQLEPVLTDGLAHGGSRSAVSPRFLAHLLAGVPGVPDVVLRARLTAQASDGATRPDLAGVSQGREVLFIEGKLCPA